MSSGRKKKIKFCREKAKKGWTNEQRIKRMFSVSLSYFCSLFDISILIYGVIYLPDIVLHSFCHYNDFNVDFYALTKE